MSRRSVRNRTWGIDDRTGRKVKHKDLRKEWTGMMVHKSEWEPRHPQLNSPRLVGPEPRIVKDARPDTYHEMMSIFNIPGGLANVNLGYTLIRIVADVNAPIVGVSSPLSVGSILITRGADAIIAGQEATTAIGSVSILTDSFGWGEDTWGENGWGT